MTRPADGWRPKLWSEGIFKGVRQVAARNCSVRSGVVWHNTDNLVLPAKVAVERICATRANSAEMRIGGVVLHPTPTGAVVQSVLHLTSKDGRHAEIPICCVVTLRDGRIQRWDDYYDSAAFGPFVAS